MKKIKYLIISCLSIALLSYGVIAFANGGTSPVSDNTAHQGITGKFVVLEDSSKIKVSIEGAVEEYPLDAAIWILRDHKKAGLESLVAGDKIEFVLNEANKIAYIKAYSKVFLKAEADALLATPTPTPVPTIAPIVTASPVPTAAPKEHKKTIHKVKKDEKLAALNDEDDDEYGEDNTIDIQLQSFDNEDEHHHSEDNQDQD